MQTLSIGAALQNNTYRIEKILGQGGFGITYLATDINLDRVVAIKEFFPKDYCERDDTTSHVTLGTKNTAAFVNRLKSKFLKEARNIAKFDHPNIIRIFAAFEENNTAYYVMEYIEGESLSAMVKRDGPLPKRRALDYIEKIGNALEYVHARKINHLDIKPANIMVRKSDDTPILIDFGLSKRYDTDGNQTSTMLTGFSHGFAPLEQYNADGVKEFSPQTDVYSLAATLYYTLSGVVPPQATRLVDEELTFPATIPVDLIRGISKAMRSGRKDRQETIAQFITYLKDSTKDNSSIRQDSQYQYTPEYDVNSEGLDEFDSDKGRSKIYLITVSVIFVFAGLILLWVNLKNEDPDGNSVKTVTGLVWQSPMGSAVYTGEVVNDTLDNGEIKLIPNGKGIAIIKSGKLAGAKYEGNFVSGDMEGHSIYTMKNGDVFTGTFHNNQFEAGIYLIKETGEYFEGTFKNKQPYKGKWYSASGQVLEELK